MTTIILRITKTNFAAQVCHDQCPVRCRGPPQEPTQKREPLHTTGECDDDDIPDICHERHEYIRVKKFWPVKILTDFTRETGI